LRHRLRAVVRLLRRCFSALLLVERTGLGLVAMGTLGRRAEFAGGGGGGEEVEGVERDAVP
jgi:hypothetical protein